MELLRSITNRFKSEEKIKVVEILSARREKEENVVEIPVQKEIMYTGNIIQELGELDPYDKDKKRRLVKNSYAMGPFLGKGGFAKVYLFYHSSTLSKFAGKVISKESLKNKSRIKKIQEEIEVHRKMNHVNICKFDHHFSDH
jgi:serine/threonine protein kinase